MFTISGTLSLSACDGRCSSEGAHEDGRALRGRGSATPVELACPILRGPSAKKAHLEEE